MRQPRAFAALAALLLYSPAVSGQKDDAMVFINTIAFGNDANCGFFSPPTSPPTESPTDGTGPGMETPGADGTGSTVAAGEGTEGADGTGTGTTTVVTGTALTGTETSTVGADATSSGTTTAGGLMPPFDEGQDKQENKKFEFLQKWYADGVPRRLQTEGPSAIHVEVASSAEAGSGSDFNITAITPGFSSSALLHPVTNYRFHTDFLYHGFSIPDGVSFADGCLLLEQDDTMLSCVVWGDVSAIDCPCNGTSINGVGDGMVWNRKNAFVPSTDWDPIPYVGLEQMDYNATETLEEVTETNCNFGVANLEQSFVGDTNSTAFINEVLLDMNCTGLEANGTFTGVETAVKATLGSATTLVLVLQDANGLFAVKSVSAFEGDSWVFEFHDISSFSETHVDEGFGADGAFSSGAALMLNARYHLISAVSWGSPRYETTIDWSRWGNNGGLRTYFPLVISQLPLGGISGEMRHLEVSGQMAAMRDGMWVAKNDSTCSPGEVNGGQSSATTTSGPSGAAHRVNVMGVTAVASVVSVLLYFL